MSSWVSVRHNIVHCWTTFGIVLQKQSAAMLALGGTVVTAFDTNRLAPLRRWSHDRFIVIGLTSESAHCCTTAQTKPNGRATYVSSMFFSTERGSDPQAPCFALRWRGPSVQRHTPTQIYMYDNESWHRVSGSHQHFSHSMSACVCVIYVCACSFQSKYEFPQLKSFLQRAEQSSKGTKQPGVGVN